MHTCLKMGKLEYVYLYKINVGTQIRSDRSLKPACKILLIFCSDYLLAKWQ